MQGSTQSSPTGIYFTRWGNIVQIRFLWNHAPSRSPSPRAGAKWHKVLFEGGDILEELSDDLVFTEKAYLETIHCSKICEEVAKKEFGWSIANEGQTLQCPEALKGVSCNFGKAIAE